MNHAVLRFIISKFKSYFMRDVQYYIAVYLGTHPGIPKGGEGVYLFRGVISFLDAVGAYT